MAKTAPVGFMTCFVCTHPDGEVKLDKNGRGYFYCPECNIQTFCRTEQQHNGLMARIRMGAIPPVTVTENLTEIHTEKPTAKAVREGFSMEFNK